MGRFGLISVCRFVLGFHFTCGGRREGGGRKEGRKERVSNYKVQKKKTDKMEGEYLTGSLKFSRCLETSMRDDHKRWR